jgi:catechol-2,3-dioxygenase
MADVKQPTRTERTLSDFRGAPDPLVRVAKLGYLAFDTSDVERLTAYYADALGFAVTERAGGSVYLTTGADHHCVVITAGEPRARTRIGFEIHGVIDDAAERLAGAGIPFERRTDPEPGIGVSLAIEDPVGVSLHLYEAQTTSSHSSVPGVRPTKLGHIASHVPNLTDIQVFYEDVLGFRWSDTVGDYFAFMRCGPDHHTLNFIARPDARGEYDGMFHVAYEMRDLSHLRDGLDHLSKHGYILEWGPGRHGAGHNIFSYHRDPDFNLVELFTELDLIFDEHTGHFEPRPWHEEYPQGPRVWEPGQPSSNIWGPKPPW